MEIRRLNMVANNPVYNSKNDKQCNSIVNSYNGRVSCKSKKAIKRR